MKKRNLAAMGLAGVMAVSMCMPVMAADDDYTFDKNTADAKETTVSYEVVDKYTVTIPSKITYSTAEGAQNTFSVTGSDMFIPEDQDVVVSVDNKTISLKTKDGLGKGEYKVDIAKGGTALGNDVTEVVRFKSGETGGTEELSLVKTDGTDDAKYAGTYTGKAKFTVGYAAASVTP